MRQLTITSLLLSFLLCVAPAIAESIYVNNMAGSDFNTGSDADNQGDNVGPMRTITAALKIARRGDRIVLAKTNVPYEECITLQGAKHSGSAFSPFIIEGNGATLDGTAEATSDQWEFVDGDIYRFRPEVGGYQYLFIDGEPAEQMLRSNGSYVSYMEPKQWCRCRGALHFMADEDKSPYAYDLRYAKHRVGITLYDVHDVVIRNLTVRGYQLDGINAHDNAMDCILSDVTSQANGRSGFSINGASRVKIVESKATLNGEVQLRLDDWSTTQVFRSTFTDKYNPTWRRYVNQMGRGARLMIDDDKLQTELQGWGLPEETDDEEPDEDQPLGDTEQPIDVLPTVEQGDESATEETPIDNPLDVTDEELLDAADTENETPAEDDLFGDEFTDEPTDTTTEEDAATDLFEDDASEDVFGSDDSSDDPF